MLSLAGFDFDKALYVFCHFLISSHIGRKISPPPPDKKCLPAPKLHPIQLPPPPISVASVLNSSSTDPNSPPGPSSRLAAERLYAFRPPVTLPFTGLPSRSGLMVGGGGGGRCGGWPGGRGRRGGGEGNSLQLVRCCQQVLMDTSLNIHECV